MSEKLVEIEETEKGYRLSIRSFREEDASFTVESTTEEETKKLLLAMKEAVSFIERKSRAKKLKELIMKKPE